jgi:hypothetical protein
MIRRDEMSMSETESLKETEENQGTERLRTPKEQPEKGHRRNGITVSKST